MDKGTQSDLHIRRLPSGGYVVREGYFKDPSRYCADLFASEDVDAALRFIRDLIVPVEVKCPQATSAVKDVSKP